MINYSRKCFIFFCIGAICASLFVVAQEDLVWEIDWLVGQQTVDVSFITAQQTKVDVHSTYLSTSLRIEGEDTDNIYLQIWNIGTKTLAEWGWYTVSTDGDTSIITIPAVSIPRTTARTITLYLDPTNTIEEDNEGNNTITVTIQPKETKPDLSIHAITYEQKKQQITAQVCWNTSKQKVSVRFVINGQKKTFTTAIMPWCSFIPATLSSFWVLESTTYIIDTYVDPDNSINEEDEQNNIFSTTQKFIFPEPIKPDVSVDGLRYDEMGQQIQAQICRKYGENLSYTKIPLTMSLANKIYTINHTLNFGRNWCTSYIMNIPTTLTPGHYTIRATVKLPVSWKEVTMSNNTMTLSFSYKAKETTNNLPTQQPQDIQQKTWFKRGLVAQYDILSLYCEAKDDYITKCTQLYDLQLLRQKLHLLLGTMLLALEGNIPTDQERNDKIILFRQKIQSLQALFPPKNDTNHTVRLLFIFAYIDYSLSLYQQAIPTQNTQEVQKFFLML